MRRPYSWSITTIAAIVCLATAHPAKSEFRFKGKPVGDKESGYAIAGAKDGDAILIANIHAPFVAAIPYEGSWDFTAHGPERLEGESRTLYMTIKVSSEGEQSAAAKLASILKNLKDKGSWVIEQDEILVEQASPVLRYRSLALDVPKELEGLNDWQWHYWTGNSLGGKWVTVHVSIKEFGKPLHKRTDARIMKALGRELKAKAVTETDEGV